MYYANDVTRHSHVNNRYPRLVSMACSFSADISRALLSLVVLTMFVFSTAWARDPAPVIDATTAPLSGTSKQSIEQRLSIVERKLDNQALVEVMSRLDSLQQEMQKLVGNMEVQTHEVSTMKKRQRDLYVDIDRRIQQLEKEVSELKAGQKALEDKLASVKMSPTSAMDGAPGVSPGTSGVQDIVASTSLSELQVEREAYNRAFNLLKDGRYDLAIASFKAFIETYPKAGDADNAQYWMGDANYVQKRYDQALKEFQKVLDNYPSSNKRPDALLRMGYTYEAKGDSKNAIRLLEQVVKDFPGSTAAHLAGKRIQEIKQGP